MRWFAGQPKPELSKFGKFLKKNGLSQAEVAEESKVNDSTIGSWCKGGENEVRRPVKKKADKVISALRALTGKPVTYKDFWT